MQPARRWTKPTGRPGIIVVSVIFPIGSILLFIRQRRGLHHQREKSNRCLGYEGVTSVQLRHASTGQSKIMRGKGLLLATSGHSDGS